VKRETYPIQRPIFLENLLPCDAILPRKGPITRTMSKRLQEDWTRAAEEDPRVLMNLRVDF